MKTAALVAPARSPVGYALQLLVLAGLVYLGCALVALLQARHIQVPPLALPAGVALAGLYLLGPAAWPGVLLGALCYNLGAGEAPTLPGIGFSAATTGGALLPAWLAHRGRSHPPTFESLRDVVYFLVFGSIAGPLLSSVVSLGGAALWPDAGEQQALLYCGSIFFAATSATVVVAAPIYAWLGPPPTQRPRGSWLEVAGLGLGLGAAAVLTDAITPVYALLSFPLLAWAALRFGARGATLVALAIYGLSVMGLAQEARLLSGIQLEMFYGMLHLAAGATGLLLAASAMERLRARAQEQLADDQYQALLAASPLAITGLDRAGRLTLWSSAAERLFGWRAEEVLGHPMPAIPPERGEEYRQLLARRSEPLAGLETVRERKDGARIDVLVHSWPLRDAEGNFAGSIEALQDISERKRAEQLQGALYRVSQAALRAGDLDELYQALHAIVAGLMPARNCYVALLDSEDRLIGFPYWVDEREPPQRARVRGRSFTDWVLRTGQPLRYQEALRTGVPSPAEATLIGLVPVDWMGAPLTVGERTIGVLAINTNEPGSHYTERDQALLSFVAGQVAFAIERKRAEEVVRRSEERFRVLALTTSDIVYDWDPATGREWWSENITSILGYQPGEIRFVADDWQALLHPDERDQVRESYESALATGATIWREEYRFRRKDGNYAWVLDRAWIERGPDGAVRRVIGAMLDVTSLREAREALRRSEDQLRQAAKMEAVGRLAGGVAHDFNNLLTSVLGHADLVLEALRPGDPLHDDLEEIKAAGTRAAALTQQLLAFSRKQVLEPRVLDLNVVVSGISRMLRRTIGEDVILVTRLAPDLGQVRADPVQMEQVLLNLAVNARDAMPDGGRLTIETGNIILPSGPGVRLRVQDTGVGMTEEVRLRLFEPFFTTKEVGKGTGLGLATAYGVVQQSGGSIGVTSAPGEGTTFEIDLPQVRAEDPLPAAAPAVAGGGGSETVLLVEDEEAVRNLTRRVLEQHGYTVLSAPNGEVALELARASDDVIHVLLTDVVMPGLSGPRLAEILMAERPGLRCLFMSGYAASALGSRHLQQGERSFLQKPFTTRQLLQRLRETLEAPVPSSA